MKQILFACFFSLLALLSTNAQCVLSGKVIDDKKESLSYVTIRLLEKDSIFIAGATTDSFGYFNFPKVNKGEYILALSSIGYTPKNLPIQVNKEHVDIGIITLPAQDVQLGEVVVKGSSFIRQKDKVLILPDKQQVKHANTGYDLLSNLMIPGLDVNRQTGMVSTLGGNATLYINGRKVDYREVQSLRPRDIEKVEYYDNPTGKYANDVVSINYITKKYETGGYVSLDGAQTIGYLKGDYNMVAKIDHKNTNYTLYGGANMNKYDGVRNEKTENYLFPDYTVHRQSGTDDSQVKNNQEYMQLNIQNQNDKRTLMGKVSFVRNDAPDNYEIGSQRYSGDYEGEQHSRNEIDQLGLMPSVSLYGNFNLSKTQQLETSVTGTYIDNTYTRDYTEDNFLSYTDVAEKFYNLDVNVNYVLQFKHQNSLTAQLYHFHKVSMSDYTGNNNYWQHLWTAESLLFLEYSQRFGDKLNLRFGPGLSSLQYHLHGDDHVSQISPRLRASLIYRPRQNQQLLIGLNIGNSFPDISTINSVDQNIDMFQIKRGNPNMDNAKLYMPKLMYNIQYKTFNIQAMFYYLNVTNAVVNDYYIEDDLLVNSYRSDANYHNLAAMLAVTWKINDNLRIKANGTWNRTMFTGALSESCNNLRASLELNYYWRDFALNVYGETPQKEIAMSSIYTRQYGKYGASISWNHGHWGAEAGVDSPFTKHNRIRTDLNTSVYNFTNSNYSRTFQQTGHVKFTYTFDFGRKTSRAQGGVNTTINSAIMKIE